MIPKNHLQEAALHARRTGRREVALSYFKKALVQTHEKKEQLSIRVYICEELRELGRPEQALKEIDEVLALCPGQLRASLVKGTIYCKQDNFDEAVQIYRNIIRRKPDHINAHLALVRTLFRSGQLDVALEILEEIADGAVGHTDVFWQLSLLYLKKGNLIESYSALDKIDSDSKFWEYRKAYRRATILMQQGKYNLAEHFFREAAKVAVDPASSLKGLATLLTLVGRSEESRQVCKSFGGCIIRSHPSAINNYVRANRSLLSELQRTGKLEGLQRIKAIAHVVLKNPEYLGASMFLVRELRAQKIFDRIRTALAKPPLLRGEGIPKVIVQYFPNPELPKRILVRSKSWKVNHPRFSFEVYSMESAQQFIKSHFDQHVMDAFNSCDQQTMKQDIFRLAYLYKLGGIFVDINCFCLGNLLPILEQTPELIVDHNASCVFGKHILACHPGNHFVKRALGNVLGNFMEYSRENRWFRTGPGLVTKSICSSLAAFVGEKNFRLWPRVSVLDASTSGRYFC